MESACGLCKSPPLFEYYIDLYIFLIVLILYNFSCIYNDANRQQEIRAEVFRVGKSKKICQRIQGPKVTVQMAQWKIKRQNCHQRVAQGQRRGFDKKEIKAKGNSLVGITAAIGWALI